MIRRTAWCQALTEEIVLSCIFFSQQKLFSFPNWNNSTGDEHADWSLWNGHEEMELYTVSLYCIQLGGKDRPHLHSYCRAVKLRESQLAGVIYHVHLPNALLQCSGKSALSPGIVMLNLQAGRQRRSISACRSSNRKQGRGYEINTN